MTKMSAIGVENVTVDEEPILKSIMELSLIDLENAIVSAAQEEDFDIGDWIDDHIDSVPEGPQMLVWVEKFTRPFRELPYLRDQYARRAWYNLFTVVSKCDRMGEDAIDLCSAMVSDFSAIFEHGFYRSSITDRIAQTIRQRDLYLGKYTECRPEVDEALIELARTMIEITVAGECNDGTPWFCSHLVDGVVELHDRLDGVDSLETAMEIVKDIAGRQ